MKNLPFMRKGRDCMKIRRIIDISRSIYPGMALWPGDKDMEIIRDQSIKNGDGCNVSSIKIGLHAGTHVDAPYHFIDDGIKIDSLDLSRFTGYAKVFELNVERCITEKDIISFPIEPGDAVFFKTANSSIPEDGIFREDFIYIDKSAADYLVEKKVRTVGVDYLSVEGFHTKSSQVHTTLLSNNIGIVEGLMLKDVEPGEYFFSCLPLKIDGVEGSPVRAVLIEEG